MLAALPFYFSTLLGESVDWLKNKIYEILRHPRGYCIIPWAVVADSRVCHGNHQIREVLHREARKILKSDLARSTQVPFTIECLGYLKFIPSKWCKIHRFATVYKFQNRHCVPIVPQQVTDFKFSHITPPLWVIRYIIVPYFVYII